jgi:sigma-E factor negative regulatory protein RseC
MIFETGTVVSKNQDSLMVETIQRSTCDSCSAQKGCGQTALTKLTGTKNEIRVLSGDFRLDSLRLGQSVTIGIPEHIVVKGSLLVYLVPVIGAVAGAWMLGDQGKTLEQDLFSILGALIGLVGGGILVNMRGQKAQADVQSNPVLFGIQNGPRELEKIEQRFI